MFGWNMKTFCFIYVAILMCELFKFYIGMLYFAFECIMYACIYCKASLKNRQALIDHELPSLIN